MNDHSTSPESAPTFRDQCVPRLSGWIYARDYAGEGPAFVLMHGLPDNLRIYDRLVPHLAATGRRVVTFDFLGFGQSDKPTDVRYGYEQQRGDLLAVVEALGLETIVPVGHDSSGPAAINFAIEHPDRAHSVVVLNSLYSRSPAVRPPELIDLFATPKYRALAEAALADPDRFAWLLDAQRELFQAALPEAGKVLYSTLLGPIIRDNFGQRPSAARAFSEMTAGLYEEVARNTARLPLLEGLDVPFRFIWGDSDPYLKSGLAEELRAKLKRSTLHKIDAGHWLQIDQAEAVATAMLADF